MCTVPRFAHYEEFPSELSQKRVPMLQLSTSGWYLHQLTVAAIKGAQYHLCLPLIPRSLLGLLVIEPKQQESLRSRGDPLRRCLLFWATLKSHDVWAIVTQQSEGVPPPESREPHSAVGRDRSNHFFFPWKCH